VKSLPKTVTGQRRDCDLNPGPSAPESSTLTTRIPSHPRYTGSAKTEGHILKTTILSNLSRFKKSSLEHCWVNSQLDGYQHRTASHRSVATMLTKYINIYCT